MKLVNISFLQGNVKGNGEVKMSFSSFLRKLTGWGDESIVYYFSDGLWNPIHRIWLSHLLDV